METTTTTALATTAIPTTDLNTVAEDVQFEDINVTAVPSVNFLEANTSAISIENSPLTVLFRHGRIRSLQSLIRTSSTLCMMPPATCSAENS